MSRLLLCIALLASAGLLYLGVFGPAMRRDSGLAEIETRARQLDTTALVVLKNGEPVLERWFEGDPRLLHVASITKTVGALAIGRLVTKGELTSLDTNVGAFFPRQSASQIGNVTLRQLLTHTSGINPDEPSRGEDDPPDIVSAALAAPVVYPPGTHFQYNNLAVNILGAIVERVAGRPFDEFVAAELFYPLGIEHFTWSHDAAGNTYISAGLRLFPADLAKLGELIRLGGIYNGKRLISDEFMEQMTSPSAQNAEHGLLFWMLRDCKVILRSEVVGGLSEIIPQQLYQKIEGLVGRELSGTVAFNELAPSLSPYGGLALLWGDTGFQCAHRGAIVGGFGDGWQGQHLIVLPQRGIVAVRMREAESSDDALSNSRYRFREELAWALQSILR